MYLCMLFVLSLTHSLCQYNFMFIVVEFISMQQKKRRGQAHLSEEIVAKKGKKINDRTVSDLSSIIRLELI